MTEKQKSPTTSLSSKIVFAVVGIIIVFGTIAALLVYKITAQNLLATNKKNQIQLTQDKAQDIRVIFEDVFSVVKQISEEKILTDALSASASPLLAKQATDVLNNYLIKDFYSTIYIMGADGKALLSTDPTFVGKDYSFRPYFTEAIKGNRYVDVGLGITSNKLGYYFSSAVYVDKKIKGIVVIKTNPQMVEKIVNYDFLEEDSERIITDDKGIVLYSSKPNRLYKSLGSISQAVVKQEQTFRFPGKTFEALDYDEVQQDILKYKVYGSFGIDDELDEKPEILSFSKVGTFPFYFIIEAETEPMMVDSANSAIVISLLVFTAAILASLVIAVIVRKSLSPISTLIIVTDEIGKGNLNYQIPSFSSTELSQLADSFKRMAINLQDLYTNLEKKVVERTKELDERNKRISKSEAILKDALDTSERANKLMVGRELEMLELKKIIKTLRETKT